ncbi:TIGR00341 family protein [Acidobacteriota bacterium]
MTLRMIEMALSENLSDDLRLILEGYDYLDLWQEKTDDLRIHVTFVLPSEKTGEILDILEKRFSNTEGFRIILIPVEASIPRLEVKKPENPQQSAEKKSVSKSIRKCREELYEDAEITTRISSVFIVLTILSALVASFGILRNNVVFIIGAMVIAPFLGPNVALSLATTLGDTALFRKAIRALSVGVLTGGAFSFLLGLILNVDPLAPELVLRTKVNLGDIVIALAAGSAAALSFTTGLLSSLIGVMVAVAFLPPLVAMGMLIGSGHWEMALGSLLLFSANLICVNLSGMVTFIIQGIRPLRWWDAQKAKKATRRAVFVWTLLLIILVILILLSSKR